MKKLISLVIISFSIACSSGFNQQELDQTVQKPVAANQKAESYGEWHASPDNPDKITSDLAQKFIAKEITSKEICIGMNKLDVVDLTLYENQIRDKKINFLFEDCEKELIQKLDQYWEKEKRSLGLPGSSDSSELDSIENQDLESEPVQRFAETPKAKEPIVENENISNEVIVAEQTRNKVSIPDNMVFSKPGVRRFDKIIEVERDVSAGYFAVAGDLPPGQVAFTFDDGPHDLYTHEILKALKDANVRATWFTKGQMVRLYPEVLKDIAKEGHSIGTHTNTHLCQAQKEICRKNNGGKVLTISESIADIAAGHQAVQDVLGWVSPFFRFPYGEGSPELKEFLKVSGTGEFFWNVDSNDWRTYQPDKSPRTSVHVVEDVVKQVKATKRGILLFHDVHKRTAVAMPAILNRLHAEGMQPVVFVPKDKSVLKSSPLIKKANELKLGKTAAK